MSRGLNNVANNATNRVANTATSKVNNKVSRVTSKVNNKIDSFFPQVDTDTNGWLIVDGREYEIDQFNIDFVQSVDHKGQPQNEVRGGKMLVALSETLPDSMYHWAMKHQSKDGEVVFKSKTGSAPLKVVFRNAHCISLARNVGAYSGLSTGLVISPEKIVINGIDFSNFWVK